MQAENDYCPRGCGLVAVRRGAEMRSVFKYASFGLPEELWNKPKVLVFHPLATGCF